MLGKFSFKRTHEGWKALYTALHSEHTENLCYMQWFDPAAEGAEGKAGWVVPIATNQVLGPFQTRWKAAHAYLVWRETPVIEADEKAIHAKWTDNYYRRRHNRIMTAEQAHAVWDVLVADCGASPRDYERESFVAAATRDKYPTTEYRFCGLLGFGGKFWNIDDKWYVSCYQEHADVETRRIMAKANLKLQELFERFFIRVEEF